MKFKTFTFLLIIFNITCYSQDFVRVNLSKENSFFQNLYEVYDKYDKANTFFETVKRTNNYLTKVIIENDVKGALEQYAIDELDFGTKTVGEIYSAVDKYVDKIELPEIPQLPDISSIRNLDNLSPAKKREVINVLLKELTLNTVYYKNKIKDFESTTNSINRVQKDVYLAKKQNLNIARTIEKSMQKGLPIPWPTWWAFSQTYQKQINNTYNKIKAKKKKWDHIVKEEKTKFENYKSNVLLLLNLEKQSLQKHYDETIEKHKEYEDEVKEIKSEINQLEQLKDRIINIKNNLELLERRKDSYRTRKNAYQRDYSYYSRKLNYLNSSDYNNNEYRGCTNDLIFDKCTANSHKRNKGQFLYNKSEKKKKYKKKRQHASSRVKKYDRLITETNSLIQKEKEKIQDLTNEIARIPQLNEKLNALEVEKEKFEKSIDFFFTIQLMRDNSNNIEKLNDLRL